MACPKCFGLMFIGSEFCAHCGAIAAPINVDLDQRAGDCPRCREHLEKMEIGTTGLRGCTRCDGLWLDAHTFESICADRESQSAVLTFFQTRVTPAQQMTKISYVPCPDCGQLMNRNNFAKASGVIVDICREHGVWFDADELPSIIEFVQKGGMELARQREKQEIREERDRLRAERYAVGNLSAEPSSTNEDNLNIHSFIQSLFG